MVAVAGLGLSKTSTTPFAATVADLDLSKSNRNNNTLRADSREIPGLSNIKNIVCSCSQRH